MLTANDTPHRSLPNEAGSLKLHYCIGLVGIGGAYSGTARCVSAGRYFFISHRMMETSKLITIPVVTGIYTFK